MRELYLRFVFGLLMVSIIVTAICLYPIVFSVLLFLLWCAMLYEWHRMCDRDVLCNIIGFTVVTCAVCALQYLLFIGQQELMLWYFINIWGTDVFAMICGKTLRGPKLAPVISPNKTISGFVCGVLCGASISYAVYWLLRINHTYHFVSAFFFQVAIVNNILAQGSDLFVSYFKRRFKIKDTGTIIPGHGGVLDRFDSICFSVYSLFFLLYFAQTF
ncbi:Phosphatidate cytidylyltransferase [Rickettsiales endosymbiont of Paramecium tredecaurelia]|uniref:phosphatidate cytidylyltransferase n=1 Tax=Candidatus Sarmatiella mevalonica TaxID=2770581 RepID=UPI00192247AA|nr:phosphatidate cytidylyltransferase [Candidatus Sarmatiella mevalonica]MBL3284648.1 Phosphatidate cytidylyltransferase [Candidatus Sarmatiella mevalonica]